MAVALLFTVFASCALKETPQAAMGSYHPHVDAPLETWWLEIADSPIHNSLLQNERFLLLENVGSNTIVSYSLGCLAGPGQVMEWSVETLKMEIKPKWGNIRAVPDLYDLRVRSCGEAGLAVTQVAFSDGTSWRAPTTASSSR
jgi:hypothetical protein